MADLNDPAPGNTPKRRRVKRSAVFTSTPEVGAIDLSCPICERPLEYRQTVISGVQPIERWDFYDCHACGPFVYRERTRRLRPAI